MKLNGNGSKTPKGRRPLFQRIYPPNHSAWMAKQSVVPAKRVIASLTRTGNERSLWTPRSIAQMARMFRSEDMEVGSSLAATRVLRLAPTGGPLACIDMLWNLIGMSAPCSGAPTKSHAASRVAEISFLRSIISVPNALRSRFAFLTFGNISPSSSFTWCWTYSVRTVIFAS